MKIQKMDKTCNPYVEKAVQNPKISDETDVNQVITQYNGMSLEIGCAHGVMLRRVAAEYSEVSFLGNDYKYKEVVLTAERCDHLNNVRVVKSDITKLVALFPEGYLESVMCFYPDPWPKRRQRKNRIWQPKFADNLSKKMKPFAPLLLKTDQEDYFEQMMEVVGESSDFEILFYGNYKKNNVFYDSIFSSFFEDLFLRQQDHSFFLLAIKKGI